MLFLLNNLSSKKHKHINMNELNDLYFENNNNSKFLIA